MPQKHTFLWRKIWSNTVLIEPDKPFSRLEAWLYITNTLAAPNDDQASGLLRGEFVASVRELAKCFHWSIGAVHRFIKTLLQNSMIIRVVHEAEHLAGQEAGHFVVCNYDTYDPPRDTSRNAERDPERNTESPVGQEAEHFCVRNHETYSLARNTSRNTEPGGVSYIDNIYKNNIYKDTPACAKASAGKPAAAGRSFGEGWAVAPDILLKMFQQHNRVLPEVKAVTAERLRKCRARVKQAVRDGSLEQYLSDFSAAVKKAQSTPFLRGEGARGWRASFDWFVANHSNVYGVLEGKYDGAAAAPNQRGGSPHARAFSSRRPMRPACSRT